MDTGTGAVGAVVVPVAVRWEWMHGVTCGLECLHRAGWVHNDVKPANILCAADGACKLCDLGLASAWPRARVASAAAAQPWDATRGAGTPPYMAPELSRCHVLLRSADEQSLSNGSCREDESAGEPSPASDVFSLGVVLAETFGGFRTAMERAATL